LFGISAFFATSNQVVIFKESRGYKTFLLRRAGLVREFRVTTPLISSNLIDTSFSV